MKSWKNLFGLFDQPSAKIYKTEELLFEGLKRQETAAIQHLAWRARHMTFQMTMNVGLREDMAEDVLIEALEIFLLKIQNGQYVFQGFSPLTYLLEIVRRVAGNLARTKRGKTYAAFDEEFFALPDEDFLKYENRREQAEQLEIWIQKLGETCQKIVRLRYLEGFSDEEIIEQKMLPNFHSVDSLKTKRSGCLKKLRELARIELIQH